MADWEPRDKEQGETDDLARGTWELGWGTARVWCGNPIFGSFFPNLASWLNRTLPHHLLPPPLTFQFPGAQRILLLPHSSGAVAEPAYLPIKGRGAAKIEQCLRILFVVAVTPCARLHYFATAIL